MPSRTVRFYKIVDTEGAAFPNDINTDAILHHVEHLADDAAYLYSRAARMELLGDVYWTSDTGKVPMLILNRISREARLRIECAREFTDFRLQPGETIASPCFVGFFPGNVVGMLRDAAAPGAARLEEYLNKVVPLPEKVKIDPLVLPDTLNLLRRESEVLTAFTFRLPGGVGERERNRAPRLVRDILRTTRADVGGVKNVTVSVVLDPRGNIQEESDRLLNAADGLLNGATGDLVEVAKVKYRSADDGGAHELDLLKQRVAMEVEVDVLDATDNASESTASRGLATAYDELLPDIRRALDPVGPQG